MTQCEASVYDTSQYNNDVSHLVSGNESINKKYLNSLEGLKMGLILDLMKDTSTHYLRQNSLLF